MQAFASFLFMLNSIMTDISIDFELLAWTVLILWEFMTFGYVVGLILKNNGFIDIFYGMAFILVAGSSMYLSDSSEPRQILLFVLTSIWAVRLSAHILKRNWGKPEDFRYQQFRRDWKKWWLVQSYFKIYMLQGLVIFFVSAPVLLVNASLETIPELGIWAYLGILIWAVGFIFESLGDLQLMMFKNNPQNKGKIMKSGVWRYTRHPNYFGEATLWWGIFLIALPMPYGLLGVLSPVLIDWLLLKVSGIPMLEEKYNDNPEYQKYKQETNAFFPWFPKKG